MPDTARRLFHDRFHRAPDVLAAAPGRIEFIGNHTDYNGGLVLGAAIDRRVVVAVARRDDARLRFTSDGAPAIVEADLRDVTPRSGRDRWVNYPLGVFHELRRDGLKAAVGFDLAITSTLPSGAGLSSSAALELATAYALTAAYGAAQDRLTLARLARRAENDFVGMPCGLLDQGVSAFGRRDHLVLVDGQAETFAAVPLPGDTAFWILNSHQQHSLVGSLYATRHEECHEALRHLRAFYPDAAALAALTPEQVHAADLPDVLRRRALHVTGEQQRVRTTAEALRQGDLHTVGQQLYASHESSRDLFENSTPELDFLVETFREAPHVHGARLTGGGFGGAVMALTDTTFGHDEADAICRRYAERFGQRPTPLLAHTADGAGVLA